MAPTMRTKQRGETHASQNEARQGNDQAGRNDQHESSLHLFRFQFYLIIDHFFDTISHSNTVQKHVHVLEAQLRLEPNYQQYIQVMLCP